MARRHLFALTVLALGTACESESAPPTGSGGSGSGGSSGATLAGSAGAVANGTSGASGAGGSAAAQGGNGGSSGGGNGNGNGGSGAAGSTGGGGQQSAGNAGQSGAGGGASGAGGSGGGAPGAAVASDGCGKAGRPSGGKVSVPNDRIYDFPETYDGQKPMPLVIALHGANNPNTILETLSNGSRLESGFVRAFPKSNGNAWSFSGGTGPDSQRITSVYEQALSSYCIDKSRVFLTGHSSGAQMSVQMMCVAGGDPRFKAVAPVAASKYCDTLTPVPVLYIQGQMDAQRNNGDGANVVAVFSASNTCMPTSMPYPAIAACNSEFDGKPVNPGCISYVGCSKPTIWCSHDDNNYNLAEGHMHGWPCFASDAIADFFLGLP